MNISAEKNASQEILDFHIRRMSNLSDRQKAIVHDAVAMYLETLVRIDGGDIFETDQNNVWRE